MSALYRLLPSRTRYFHVPTFNTMDEDLSLHCAVFDPNGPNVSEVIIYNLCQKMGRHHMSGGKALAACASANHCLNHSRIRGTSRWWRCVKILSSCVFDSQTVEIAGTGWSNWHSSGLLIGLVYICTAAEEQARPCISVPYHIEWKIATRHAISFVSEMSHAFKLNLKWDLDSKNSRTRALQELELLVSVSWHRFAITLAYWGCGSSIISCAFGSGSISDRTLQLRPFQSLEVPPFKALTQNPCYSPSLHHVGFENIERHWVTRGIQPPAEEVLVSL